MLRKERQKDTKREEGDERGALKKMQVMNIHVTKANAWWFTLMGSIERKLS